MPKKFLVKLAWAGILLLVLALAAVKIKNFMQKPPESRSLTKLLQRELPSHQRLLTDAEEKKVAETIGKTLGIKSAFTLEGNRLNNQWGLMGLEQYLMRFEGDTVADRAFPQVGMAPGRGAFGYFDNTDQEKYYVVVQTLYLPDWASRAGTLKYWYRFRKVVVVNPETGAAVVGVVGDSGPAKFTDRQFGGSPQVMYDLGFYPKTHEGRVLLLFVDDPKNKVPLGPIEP
jgi:hypothetical protein